MLPSGNPAGPTGTPISLSLYNNTFSDVAISLTQSISRDGQTPISGDLRMDGHNHIGVKDGSQLDQYASVKQLQNSDGQFLTNVAGTNNVTGDTVPMVMSYTAGQTFSFVAVAGNTGAMTLDVASIGVKNITKNGTVPIEAGDISAGSIVTVVYDGTKFQLIGPSPIPRETIAENSYLNFTGVSTRLTAGTSPNFTLTVDEAPKFPAFTLTAGQRFRVLFHTNGGASNSLNVNGSGAKPIKARTMGGYYDPAIVVDHYYDLQYNGTDYVVLNPVEHNQVGEYFWWPRVAAPNHGLVCNGANVSRTVYARLFAVIDTAYGAGDGSTTFGLPNLSQNFSLVMGMSGTMGTPTAGEVINHLHYTRAVGSGSGGNQPLCPTNGPFTQATTDTGGDNNLAAGLRANLCIRF